MQVNLLMKKLNLNDDYFFQTVLLSIVTFSYLTKLKIIFFSLSSRIGFNEK
jgi:hypothetical protein